MISSLIPKIYKRKKIIQILTCMYNRPLVSELFALTVTRLQSRFSHKYKITIHAIVSEEESAAVCKKYGFSYQYAENRPLGAKWNHGINDVMKNEFDYLLVCSDDDVLSDRLLEKYELYIKRTIPYFGLNRMYMYCTHSQKALYFIYKFNTSKLIGSARMISRSLLEHVCLQTEVELKKDMLNLSTGDTLWLPHPQVKYFEAMGLVNILTNEPTYRFWDPYLNKGLDNSSESFLVSQNYFPVVVQTEEVLLTGIKSSVNIWTFESFENLGSLVPGNEALSFFSPAERKQLEKIRKHEMQMIKKLPD